MTDQPSENSKPRLSGIAPGSRSFAPEHGIFYSRVARNLRVVLLLAAVAFIAVLSYRLLRPDNNEIALAPASEKPQGPPKGEIEMTGAKYEGIDAQNRPYTITAAHAARALGEGQIIDLEQLQADVTLADESWLAASADFGKYDQEKNRLQLSGVVRLFHDSGYELETASLDVDLQAGSALGDAPVQAQGPAARLQSVGIRVENMGEKIVFTGPVTMTVQGHAPLMRSRESKNKG